MTDPAETTSRPLRTSDYLLWGFLALLAFTLPHRPTLELDPSWRQALAYFLQQGFPFGESIVFTYGPLGFLMGNTYMGLFWEGYILWKVGFSILAAGLLVHVARPLTGVSRFLYFTFFIVWGVGYADALQMIIIAFCGWVMVQRSSRGESGWSIPIGVFLALLAVIKFTNLLFTGFIVVVVVTYHLISQQRKSALQLLGAYAIGFLVIWMACGQSPLQWLSYALNSLEISSGYQASMGLPTPDGQLGIALLTFGGLAGYVVWHALTQPDRIRAGANLLIMAAFLFLNWKHGFVRADGHMLGFFYCAMALAVAFPALFSEQLKHGWIPRIFLGAVMVCCIAGMRGTFTSTIDYAANITNERLVRNIQALLDWDRARGDLEGQVDHWRREGELPDTKLLVGDASVDVLGYEQAIALYNDFNYQPRPIFQSYSAYTPKLAAMNADYIAGENGPEFLLLKLQTIDDRPLLADDSHVLNLFPHYYAYRLTEKDFHVFARRPEVPSPESLAPRLLRTTNAPIGEPISLAEFGVTHLWIEVDLPFNLLGRAMKFLYKPPLIFLRVVDMDGKEIVYRIPRPIGLSGFQINPLVTDFTSYLEAHGGTSPRLVRSISIEVAEADRRWFDEQAVIKISAMQPTDLKNEVEKRRQLSMFEGFYRLPKDFFAKTEVSRAVIDEREAVVIHAPSRMIFDFEGGNTLSGIHGYIAGAYTDGGETDGATFRIHWRDGDESRELYERNLRPFTAAADRGMHEFNIDVSGLPAAGELWFDISINGNPAWDWTTWGEIQVR